MASIEVLNEVHAASIQLVGAPNILNPPKTLETGLRTISVWIPDNYMSLKD